MQGPVGYRVSEAQWDPISKWKSKTEGWGCSLVVKLSPSMNEAPGQSKHQERGWGDEEGEEEKEAEE